MKKKLLQNLKKVEKLAVVSKVQRLLSNPYKYLAAIGYRQLVYARTKKEWEQNTKTFFGQSMKVLLPSATDIYITGGKSHDSEIRLAKFLINTLKSKDHFLDIGAHYGYFSLLAAHLVGEKGRVVAVEAAPRTFRIVNENLQSIPQAFVVPAAIADKPGSMTFYEFPNKYSEYNTIDVAQFEGEEWYAQNQPTATEVSTHTLDEIISKYKIVPATIKIDVEGAEHLVIAGGNHFLQQNNPIVVMEYLSEARGNTAHQKAAELLFEMKYIPHFIASNGELREIKNISIYFKSTKIDSDNIVFCQKKVA